jgi:uncharacterized damage-inducible protein DinB
MSTPVEAWVSPEVCEQCRFDGTQYDVSDARGTLRGVGPMWHQLAAGLSDDVLGQRPEAGVWSAVEYASHSADVAESIGRLLHATTLDDELALDDPGEPSQQPATAGGAEAAVERLEANIARIDRKAKDIGADDEPGWARSVRIGDTTVDAGWLLRHVVHDLTHHLHDAGRGLHLLGAGAPTQEGVVAQLSASDGGVPKRPVKVAEVGDRGLVGDRQADRRNHGRPLQALCLWSTEVIQALQAEGHPIQAGAAGENVTISGIEWTTLRTGVQVLIGDVLAEVSAYSTPCAKNAAWFVGGEYRRMDHDRHPGWSRVYAWVREPGTIRLGDAVVVEP